MVGLGICRDSKSFFGSGVGVGLADSEMNLLSRVLFNHCSILLQKCVCQPQIVYVYLDSETSPQTPTTALSQDPGSSSSSRIFIRRN